MSVAEKPTKLLKGMTGDWQVVVGMEVHAQVTSNAKLFSGASTAFGSAPNSQVSLVDAAMPGMLPIIKKRRSTSSRSSTARTISIPTCRRATRSANTSRR